MTKGQHYIEAIDLLLDSELHRIQQARDEKIAAEISHLVEPFGINPHSRRLAGAFRSTKTSDKDATEQNRIKVFQERFPELKTLDESKLADLISTLEKLMSPADVDLYSERTKLSTVSTVIRPLSTKWLERWRTQRSDGFDYEAALKAANALLETDISSNDVADVWFQNVFDLFTDLVVFRVNRNEVVHMNARRPIGMVSEANERIYRRNWADFVGKHKQIIQNNADSLAAGNRVSAYSNSYRPKVDFSYNYVGSASGGPYRQTLTSENTRSAEQPEVSATFTVTIESADEGGGSATKKWNSKTHVEQEVAAWIDKVSGVWGESGALIHATLEVVGTNGDSKVEIPNKTPHQAQAAIKTLLN